MSSERVATAAGDMNLAPPRAKHVKDSKRNCHLPIIFYVTGSNEGFYCHSNDVEDTASEPMGPGHDIRQ